MATPLTTGHFYDVKGVLEESPPASRCALYYCDSILIARCLHPRPRCAHGVKRTTGRPTLGSFTPTLRTPARHAAIFSFRRRNLLTVLDQQPLRPPLHRSGRAPRRQRDFLVSSVSPIPCAGTRGNSIKKLVFHSRSTTPLEIFRASGLLQFPLATILCGWSPAWLRHPIALTALRISTVRESRRTPKRRSQHSVEAAK